LCLLSLQKPAQRTAGLSGRVNAPAQDKRRVSCHHARVTYRTIEISWKPRSPSGWATYTAARREAARLWNGLVERHHRIRRRNLHWPSKARWQRWAKRRYPGLSAQSAQQVIGEFCEAVHSARQLRKHGHPDARYPWKKLRFRDVVYTNQDARLRSGWLILPNGTSGTLRIRLPEGLPLPGRLMEARLGLHRVCLVCEVPDDPQPAGPTLGVDLGVNTLIAATDGETAVLVSGREAKATVQWRNKRLASAASQQSKKTKGSRRWKRLQRRKRKMLAKSHRRLTASAVSVSLAILPRDSEQVADWERLGEEGDRPEWRGQVSAVGDGREDDNRDGRPRWVRKLIPAELNAVHHRHHQVQQYQAR
jgi:Probable transposase